MSTITLRPATPADIPIILRFVRELAAYSREPDAVVATEAMLHNGLCGPNAAARAVLAEDDGSPVGFAVYFTTFSTWLGRPGLYLEDLYVVPSTRGRGVGKQFLTYLARVASEQGYGRVEWAVLDWNDPAIRFYQAAGAVPLDTLTIYRLAGDALTGFPELQGGP